MAPTSDHRTIEVPPAGETRHPARIEWIGLLGWAASLAAYLIWLLVFGVNV